MSEGEPAGQKLHVFDGGPPEPQVAGDLLELRALPGSARQRFWEVLGPSLDEPIPRDVEARLDRFIAEHGADPAALTRALRASRALVRKASALDLDARRFGDDLAALAGGSADLAEVLMPGYERAKATVRGELIRRTLANHGPVLERVGWKLDVLTASDQGLGFRLPVLTLTLHYRQAGRTEQLSVQVLPQLLAEIRAICDRLLPGRR